MKKIWIVIGIIWLLTGWATAETQTEESLLTEQYDASGIEQVYDGLEDDTKNILERWGLNPERVITGDGINAKEVWQVICELAVSCVRNPVTAGASSAMVLLLCSLLQTAGGNEKGNMQGIMQFFGTVSIAAAVIIPAGYTLSKTASALGATGSFMLAFVPVFAGILISMGRSLSAAGTCSLVFGFSQFIVYLANHLLMPFIGMFLSLAVCEAASQGVTIGGFTSAAKKIITWILGLATTVFTAILGITGIINNASDSVAQRTTRYFVGNMVPVIGGTLADTISTVQGCLSLLRTGSGVMGLGAILVLLLPVIVEILIWRSVIMLLSTLSDVLGTTSASRLIKAVGDGMGLLLSVVICCLVVYTVCLSLLLLTGSAGQ